MRMTDRRILFKIVAAFSGILLLVATPAIAADEPAETDSRQPAGLLDVGVAAVDITPDYPVRLSGFGFRRAESEGILHAIWAKALAIGSDRDEDGPAVLVTVDNLGIPATMVDELAERLAAKAGVRRERLAVTATHTHTAPMLTGVAPTLFGQPIPPDHQQHIDRYTRELADKLEEVTLAALADRQLGRVDFAIGTVEFAKNRRTPGGPVDHDLPVLFVTSPEGRLRAVYAGYACHCVTLSNNLIGGDWAGFAQELIQRGHPGAVALVAIGCGADQNPLSGVTGDKADVARAQGAQIAAEVDRLLKGLRAPLRKPPRAKLTTIELPFDTLPTRAEWEDRAQRDDAIGYHARIQLARLDRGEALQTKIDYPIQTWLFADELAMVFLPGEVVVDYALRLKREFDRARLWVHGYSNDAPCYIPSERVLQEGGYEGANAMVYYDRPTRFAPGLEDRIIGVVREQLGASFKAPYGGDRTGGTLPMTPQQSLKTLRTHDELEIELVAAEPLVVDPVAIDFGPDGRLWVAEMIDYPSGVPADESPPVSSGGGGRIRVLTDTNADGRFDSSTVFLDGLPFPTGVTVWNEGVLVCAAPDVLYAQDTDGDGRADVSRVVLAGFATHNYQGRVNSLRYGLDGWLYGAGGLFGGQITISGGRPQPLENRDFRFRPEAGLLEPAAGRTQQGRCRDEWGNWFGCTNGTFIKHYPLAEHVLARNPHVVPPASEVALAADAESSRLYSIHPQLQLFKLSGPPDRATSACGLEIYCDNRLGEEYAGNAFVCEPVNLVVHRLVLEPRGTTFTTRRAQNEADREFLASADNWFRPVEVRTGPDGALWIVDMYRYVIEHPRWIPEDTLAALDVRAGRSMGRIYRICRKDAQPGSLPRLSTLDAQELVDGLESAAGPLRDLARQQILRSNDPSIASRLERLVSQGRRPTARLHALLALADRDALGTETVVRALQDLHPGVRRHAARLAGPFVSDSSDVRQALFNRVDDPDPHVRRELAAALGDCRSAEAAAALAKLLLSDANDEYVRTAALTSVCGDNLPAVVEHVLAVARERATRQSSVESLSVLAAAFEHQPAFDRLLADQLRRERETTPAARWTRLAGMLAAVQPTGRSFESLLTESRRAQLQGVIAEARRTVADPVAEIDARLAAIGTLGRLPSVAANDRDTLGSLLVPQESAEIHRRTVDALSRIGGGATAPVLLRGWSSYTPQLRGHVLDALLSRTEWTSTLLDALSDGAVSRSELDASRRQRLLEHRNAAVHTRAAELLGRQDATDRAQVVAAYGERVLAGGNTQRAPALFKKHCATCHRIGDVGQHVGPDLAALSDRSPAALLAATLDPNRALDARYAAYVAVTTDGRTHTGIVVDESAGSLTLADAEGQRTTLRRDLLEELRNTGKSLMPDGLEKDISPADLADLIAWLGTLPAGDGPHENKQLRH